MKNMKKLIALLLCILAVASLVACNKAEEYPAEPAKDYSAWAGLVADSTSWIEAYKNLPVANEDMTATELRQLCVDVFKANLSFPWTPNKHISYTYTLGGSSSSVMLPAGRAYSGLCYATGVEGATTGNIDKILSYYDEKTGVLDVEAMGNKFMGMITSACSYGALQGWNRVVNSHNIQAMRFYNQTDGNIVPVGPYTYDTTTYNANFGSDTATTEIIYANGYQTMYESLAAMQPADGLYSSPVWHVMMCSSVPVVERNADGTINPYNSYLLVCEQDTYGTKGNKDPIAQSDGKLIYPLGTVDNKYTFDQLIKKGYIPFTFKEFLDQDPIEAGKAWLGNEAAPVKSGADMTASAIFGKTVGANYVINNILIEIKDAEGKNLYTYDPSIFTHPSSRSVSLNGHLPTEKLTPYANGKNTIHIMVQLANGELIDAFNTVLKFD